MIFLLVIECSRCIVDCDWLLVHNTWVHDVTVGERLGRKFWKMLSFEHKIPWYPHYKQANLGRKHHSSGKAGTAALVLPPQDEKIISPPSNPHHFLQKHHRECDDQLHLGVVWQLYSCRLEEPPESGEDSRKKS